MFLHISLGYTHAPLRYTHHGSDPFFMQDFRERSLVNISDSVISSHDMTFIVGFSCSSPVYGLRPKPPRQIGNMLTSCFWQSWLTSHFCGLIFHSKAQLCNQLMRPEAIFCFARRGPWINLAERTAFPFPW